MLVVVAMFVVVVGFVLAEEEELDVVVEDE